MFAERLKTRRTSLRMTRSDLAKGAGVSARTIQNYEEGASSPSPGVLLNMAQALGVSVAWLKGDTEDAYVDMGARVQEHSEARKKGLAPQVGYASVVAYLRDAEPELVRDMFFRVWLERQRQDDFEEEEEFPKMLQELAEQMLHWTAQREKGVDRLMEIQAEIDARGSK